MCVLCYVCVCYVMYMCVCVCCAMCMCVWVVLHVCVCCVMCVYMYVCVFQFQYLLTSDEAGKHRTTAGTRSLIITGTNRHIVVSETRQTSQTGTKLPENHTHFSSYFG